MAESCLFSTGLPDPGDFLQDKTQLETVRQTRLFYVQVLEPVEESPAAIRPALEQKRLMIFRCPPYTMRKSRHQNAVMDKDRSVYALFRHKSPAARNDAYGFLRAYFVLSHSLGSGKNIRR